MSETIILGIDCGGTHTDAALLAVNGASCRLLAKAKTATLHNNLPASIADAVHLLSQDLGKLPENIARVTIGTTLEINALVQGKADKVGLALTAGPGLDPVHFALGEHVCIVPGGLDHRGVEVEKPYLDILAKEAPKWAAAGITTCACVGKFSPRNPEHEDAMAQTITKACGLPVTMGHMLSGKLNFPRRIATAYYNAAVARLHANFLSAVENGLAALGIKMQLRLLKADGGAIPFQVSAREPVQSILSGPAASVMGALAIWPGAAEGCSLLLDMGGTTTDIAMFLNGSPVVDRAGMTILGRHTLVRSLASISIAVGGDSCFGIGNTSSGKPEITVGPEHLGPARAFGGQRATLLDALNFLDGTKSGIERGDLAASVQGIKELAKAAGQTPEAVASAAVSAALAKIAQAAYELVERVNSRPVYTLAALKAARQARPTKICLVGGPAECIRDRLAQTLGLPIEIPPNSSVANAIGAALTVPTASLEVYADTGKGMLTAPALNYSERIPASWTLEQAKATACDLLRQKLTADGITDSKVEVVEADLFATLDDYGRGSKDMRVACQVQPGIVSRMLA